MSSLDRPQHGSSCPSCSVRHTRTAKELTADCRKHFFVCLFFLSVFPPSFFVSSFSSFLPIFIHSLFIFFCPLFIPFIHSAVLYFLLSSFLPFIPPFSIPFPIALRLSCVPPPILLSPFASFFLPSPLLHPLFIFFLLPSLCSSSILLSFFPAVLISFFFLSFLCSSFLSSLLYFLPSSFPKFLFPLFILLLATGSYAARSVHYQSTCTCESLIRTDPRASSLSFLMTKSPSHY